MVDMETQLILGSGSPRRKQYFDDLGLFYTVLSAEIDETPQALEPSVVYVERLALEKALAVRAMVTGQPALRILAADTIVVADDALLGKPESTAHATAMLQQLSGRTHSVIGGIVLLDETGTVLKQAVSETEVDFTILTPAMISAYVASGEPMDKAGAYAIQGLGAQFVTAIRGSYSNVVGLDIAIVAGWLRAEGFLA